MKIAIFGGSFNPVHIGHLALADSVISTLNYDRVIMVPAYQSPFKAEMEGAAPRDRLDMLSVSIRGNQQLGIDDCEIKREGVSYTIDTVRDIKSRYRPDGKPGLIVGDDLVSGFSKWKSAAELAEEVDIIIGRRLSAKEFPYPHTTLNNDLINISSNAIREKIKKEKDWRYLVTSQARRIIEERGLYGLKKSGAETRITASPGIIEFMENEAWRLLNLTRFLHSRNTALTAYDLCGSYNVDPQAGYLAGITHDICKNMSGEEMMRLAKADGKAFSALEKSKPALLHGRAAAVLLKTKYGIGNKEILNAVASHVTCDREMCDLAKVLYIADKTEYSRDNVLPALRDLFGKTGLDILFTSVLEETVKNLKSKYKEISLNAQKWLDSAKKGKKHEKKSKI